MKKFLIFLSIYSANIWAKDYALVIGGTSSKSDNPEHEFARDVIATAEGFRAQGREVTTLFGSFGVEEKEDNLSILKSRNQTEAQMYQKDYQEFEKRFPQTKAISKKNILDSIVSLADKAKEGDKVTILLYAHGHTECEKPDASGDTGQTSGFKDAGVTTAQSDFDPNCHHEIEVMGENGERTRFKTSEIVPYLKKLEDKGAKVNLVVDSCFSGTLKKELSTLNDTCSVLLATGDSWGLGCFEKDPEDSLDYTATLSYVKYMSYLNIADQLAKDPYFEKSKCFAKIKNHAEQMGLQDPTASISETYWQAWSKDSAAHEPSISDLFGVSYFQSGQFSEELNQMFGDQICTHNVGVDLDQVEAMLPQTLKAAFHDQTQAYLKVMNEYNSVVSAIELLMPKRNSSSISGKLDPSKGGTKPQDDKARQERERLQKELAELSKKVVESERKLAPYFKFLADTNDNASCRRPL